MTNTNPKVLMSTGGGHRTEIELMKRIRTAGINLHAAIESTSPNWYELQDAGVPVRRLDLTSNADIRSVRKLRRWIKEEKFDVVHGLANRQVANFIWASYGLPNKVVAYRGTLGHISRWDPTCYIKWLNPRIDRIACVSHAVERDLLAHGIPQERLTTIYKGHDPSWYADSDPATARTHLLGRFNIPQSAVIVALVANMRPVKGADLLIEAMSRVSTNVHAVLIGEVRDDRILRATESSPARDRVHFMGYQRDAYRIVAGCDLSVVPSREREGLSKAVIESMLQGVPVIVSDAGGLPEMVSPGVDGLIFPAGDIHKLAGSVSELSTDTNHREALGIAGRNKALDVFSINNSVVNTISLYKKLIKV